MQCHSVYKAARIAYEHRTWRTSIFWSLGTTTDVKTVIDIIMLVDTQMTQTHTRLMSTVILVIFSSWDDDVRARWKRASIDYLLAIYKWTCLLVSKWIITCTALWCCFVWFCDCSDHRPDRHLPAVRRAPRHVHRLPHAQEGRGLVRTRWTQAVPHVPARADERVLRLSARSPAAPYTHPTHHSIYSSPCLLLPSDYRTTKMQLYDGYDVTDLFRLADWSATAALRLVSVWLAGWPFRCCDTHTYTHVHSREEGGSMRVRPCVCVYVWSRRTQLLNLLHV